MTRMNKILAALTTAIFTIILIDAVISDNNHTVLTILVDQHNSYCTRLSLSNITVVWVSFVFDSP